jgi:hypothetical protein
VYHFKISISINVFPILLDKNISFHIPNLLAGIRVNYPGSRWTNRESTWHIPHMHVATHPGEQEKMTRVYMHRKTHTRFWNLGVVIMLKKYLITL